MSAQIHDLPSEVLVHIGEYLPVTDLKTFSLVSREFNRSAHDCMGKTCTKVTLYTPIETGEIDKIGDFRDRMKALMTSQPPFKLHTLEASLMLDRYPLAAEVFIHATNICGHSLRSVKLHLQKSNFLPMHGKKWEECLASVKKKTNLDNLDIQANTWQDFTMLSKTLSNLSSFAITRPPSEDIEELLPGGFPEMPKLTSLAFHDRYSLKALGPIVSKAENLTSLQIVIDEWMRSSNTDFSVMENLKRLEFQTDESIEALENIDTIAPGLESLTISVKEWWTEQQSQTRLAIEAALPGCKVTVNERGAST